MLEALADDADIHLPADSSPTESSAMASRRNAKYAAMFGANPSTASAIDTKGKGPASSDPPKKTTHPSDRLVALTIG